MACHQHILTAASLPHSMGWGTAWHSMTLARLPPPFVLQANVSNIKLSDKTFTYSICKGAMIDVSLTGEWFVGACMPAWHKSECVAQMLRSVQSYVQFIVLGTYVKPTAPAWARCMPCARPPGCKGAQ